MEKIEVEIDKPDRRFGDKMDVDEALHKSGPFGLFQVLVQIFFMYAIFTSAYQSLSNYFEGSDSHWTCMNVSNNTSRFCKENMGKIIEINSANFSKRCHLNRSEWKYTRMKSFSYVTEFDLICERNALGATIDGVFFIGSAVACLISGTVSDIYGRKIVLFTALTLLSFSSLITCFLTQIWHLIALRMLIGASQTISFSIAYIYLEEFITLKHRSISGSICGISFSLSILYLASISYFEERWQYLQLYLTLPTFLAVVGCIFVPKSPRWLLATNEITEAENVIKRIAVINKRTISNLSLRLPEVTSQSDYKKKFTYIHLFKSQEALKIVICQGIISLSGGILYFGVTLLTSSLGGNMNANFMYVAIPDLPCCLITIYLCHYLGRKKTVLITYVLSGLSLGAIALVIRFVESNYVINIVLSMFGKSFLNIAYNAGYVWTFELFPTVLRTQGFSLCTVLSSIGGFLAPFLRNVLQGYSQSLPYEMMCVLGLLSGLIGLLLPETGDSPTRETYEDFFQKDGSEVVSNHNVNEVE